jgi:hypothetical protein
MAPGLALKPVPQQIRLFSGFVYPDSLAAPHHWSQVGSACSCKNLIMPICAKSHISPKKQEFYKWLLLSKQVHFWI